MAGSRLVIPVGSFTLALLLAACAVEQSAPARGAGEVSDAAHFDRSPPLTLLPPAPRSGTFSEHEVKPIPRPLGARVENPSQRDSVLQAEFHSSLWQIISPAAPALVMLPEIGQRCASTMYLNPRAIAFSVHSMR